MSIHVPSTLLPSLDHEWLCKFVFLQTPPNHTNEIQLQLINLIFRYYNEHLISSRRHSWASFRWIFYKLFIHSMNLRILKFYKNAWSSAV